VGGSSGAEEAHSQLAAEEAEREAEGDDGGSHMDECSDSDSFVSDGADDGSE